MMTESLEVKEEVTAVAPATDSIPLVESYSVIQYIRPVPAEMEPEPWVTERPSVIVGATIPMLRDPRPPMFSYTRLLTPLTTYWRSAYLVPTRRSVPEP